MLSVVVMYVEIDASALYHWLLNCAGDFKLTHLIAPSPGIPPREQQQGETRCLCIVQNPEVVSPARQNITKLRRVDSSTYKV